MNSPLSVGIIGAGEMVSRYHLPTLLALKPEVRVDWITDADPGKAKLVARAFRVPAQSLPDNPANLPVTDIVLMAIPYGTRGPYWKSLRERPSAIYLEKPIALSADEHRELCATFPPYKFGCGYQRRSWGPTQMTKRLIEDELFGSLQRISLGFGQPGITLWGGGYSSDIRLAGGGVIFEFAVHALDQILYCASAESVEASRVRMIVDGGYDLHTEAEVKVTTKNHRRIDCSITISRAAVTSESLDFHFQHATVSMSLTVDDITVRNLRNDRTYRLAYGNDSLYPSTPRQTLYEHWLAFIQGLRTSRLNRTCATESILTTDLVEQLYRARQ